MVFLILLLTLLVSPAAIQAQDSAPPLRDDEIVRYLQIKAFTQQQLADMVQQRGLGFRLTDSLRKEFKKAGASAALLDAIEKTAEAQKKRSTTDEKKAQQKAQELHGLTTAASPIPVSPPPELSQADQVRFIEETRKNALSYTDNLPNFLCLQVTKRMVDWSHEGNWQTVDIVQAKLGYNEHREHYELIMVGNQAVNNKSMESIGGAVSTGEFGTLLRELFVPETFATFEYVAPATLRERAVQVFNYRVKQSNSRWSVVWEFRRPDQRSIVPGYHGRIVVDAETKQVMRLWMQADDIPSDFPIRAAASTLDYDYAKISDVAFLLPSKAIIEMKETKYDSRNEITFRQYRKFSTESTIKFDEAPEPDQPAKPPQQPPAVKKP